MSLIDKQNYLRDLEHRLGDYVPANDAQRILASAFEALKDYELTSSQTGGGGPDSEDLLRFFLDAKRVEGRSEKTVERYRYILRRLQEGTQVPFEKMTVYHIRSYLTAEKDRGISPSTLDGNRQVYSAFYGWLFREGLIPKNPLMNMTAIKQPKVVRKPYSPTELARLQRAALNPKSSRDSAIIYFLLTTGCRVSEVCALNEADVNLKDQTVIVRGKGNKQRPVWFDDVAALYLTSYLAERTDDRPALFVGRGSDRLTPAGVRTLLKRIGKKAGVENVHPHRFRRTRATSLIDKGMPIQEVAAVLGHDKIDTTMGYVYIDERNVANDFRKYG